MKRNEIAYWLSTLLFLLPTAGGGVPELLWQGPSSTAAIMTHLGYPLYVMRILGFAKILGALAIVTNRNPRLKEWAYAGFTFDFLGAAASHAFVGDKVQPFIPLAFLAALSVSYVSWRRLEEASLEGIRVV